MGTNKRHQNEIQYVLGPSVLLQCMHITVKSPSTFVLLHYVVLLPNVEHLYLRHIAVDALNRYQPDPEVSQ